MLEVKSFIFNPFQENTFLLFNEKKEVLIIDPGAYFAPEQKILLNYLSVEKLNPVRLLNTHCHIDHIFSNQLIFDRFGLRPEFHQREKPVFDDAVKASVLYNIPFEGSPAPSAFLTETDEIQLGEDTLSILLTPGHSPGSLCFYCKKQGFLIGGDVLFRESVGRTDLPGGDYHTLENSIREQLYQLPEETVIYPGHGAETTIGHEKEYNPFVSGSD